jgi:L-lactate dehydrogenase complex protein LldG
MTARDDILDRVREKLGRNADNAAPARRAIDACLAARQQGPRPRVDGDLLERFKGKSEALSTTVEIVAEWPAVPAAVARYLTANQLPTKVVGWPLVAGHETGTLMLLSGPDTPGSVSLLPETHIAIVAASRLVPGMEEAWNLARAERNELPRAVNFISGPSRTGDIEQTIVLGAHGPYRVHVVIVTGA